MKHTKNSPYQPGLVSDVSQQRQHSAMSTKRRAAPEDPFETANSKTDEQFIADYLQPDWITEWTHPQSGAKYAISLRRAAYMGEDNISACFNLIKETSQKDYENSSTKWRPEKKLAEMRSPELRYVLVRDESDDVRGFTSLMPTFEEGQPVVYCYEIHLKPELQGTGLASLLMDLHTTVARNLPPITKVMLTCFVGNKRGLAFYRKLGFEEDAISPVPRKLRFGKIKIPDYAILSKRVHADREKGVLEAP
ncbi:acyl-CoA N-acyltransferase [Apodospora peruviana]|uniref:N-alpha-acetyltransferase 40 n=1 Tax=Apodospora peruviana TaxID=516989 RepID=A0AAE0IBQ9_9PEZI|nr:acyl-CoA N-acyltransferase [Apodospora peruviana]